MTVVFRGISSQGWEPPATTIPMRPSTPCPGTLPPMDPEIQVTTEG